MEHTTAEEHAILDEAIAEAVAPDGSLVIGWHLTAAILNPDGTEWLAHRSSEMLTPWAAAGYLQAAAVAVNQELHEQTRPHDDDEP